MNNFIKLTNDTKNMLNKNYKIQIINKLSNKLEYNGVLSDFEYYPNFIKVFIPSIRKSKIIYMDNYDIIFNKPENKVGGNIDELNKPIYKPKWYFVYKKKKENSNIKVIKSNNKTSIVSKIKKDIVKEKDQVEKENINKYYKKNDKKVNLKEKEINRTAFKKKLMELIKSM